MRTDGKQWLSCFYGNPGSAADLWGQYAKLRGMIATCMPAVTPSEIERSGEEKRTKTMEFRSAEHSTAITVDAYEDTSDSEERLHHLTIDID
jgi:hypothetical protein